MLRDQILDALAQGEMTSAQLRAALPTATAPSINNQLLQLMRAGLVERPSYGRYRLAPAAAPAGRSPAIGAFSVPLARLMAGR